MKQTILTEQKGKHSDMLMDVTICEFEAGETQKFIDNENESAFLLLTGKAKISWNGNTSEMSRSSLFNELPYCLHVPKGVEVEISTEEKTEVLLQQTVNDRTFDPVFYTPDDLEEGILGGDQMQGAARRLIRDIFLYDNAPYSNMVLGEIIHFPGRWSSWPPHHHDQPEVYYYRFDKPQGFGVSIVGDKATVMHDGDFEAIPGGVAHPQVTAPGYAMYYTWMIRHFDDNPWQDRIYEPEHKWMMEPDAKFWDKD